MVDDSDDNRTLILSYLKHTHSQIGVAENGQAALDMFAPGRYDVILMDVEMPVMDGYEATREIRRIEGEIRAVPTPIFALTAHAFADMAVKGLCGRFYRPAYQADSQSDSAGSGSRLQDGQHSRTG